MYSIPGSKSFFFFFFSFYVAGVRETSLFGYYKISPFLCWLPNLIHVWEKLFSIRMYIM